MQANLDVFEGSDSDFTPLASSANFSYDSSDDPNSVNLNVTKSGDLQIDALSHGHKWTTPTITYSFFDDANGGPYYSSKYKGVRELTGKIKSYLRHILEEVIEPLINVDFVEVNDTKNNYGQIRYLFSTYPSSASTSRLSSSSDVAGDVKINPSITKDIEKGPGSYRYETLIHETLHALGMKHPGNYNGSSNGGQDGPFLSDNVDHSGNTVLSYNRFKYDNPHNGVITPMTYDIKALQYLYGAKEHEAGDTTYKFDSVSGYTIGGKFFGSKTQDIKQTVWDSAGRDTFDFSGLASNKSGYYFDLTDGGWITTQDAYMSASYEARGNKKTYNATALGTKTAFGAIIENLVTSTSNDTIIANKAANIFSGYNPNITTGDDTIINSNGQDQLDLSGYKSADVTQTTSGDNLVLGLGGNGSVTLKDYFAASQSDRIQILFDGAAPPPPSGQNTVMGTGGNDLLEGTGGNDLIRALSGDDTLRGLSGNDTLRGGKGNDWLRGGKGNDALSGSHGDDTLEGGQGADILDGGSGNDILIGGSNNDVLTGGDGQDTFVYEKVDHRRDTITDFELGIDKIDLSDIFKGSDYTSTNAFSDYVQLEQLGADTKVRVDILGDNGDQFKTMAQLTNVDKTALSADHFVLT